MPQHSDFARRQIDQGVWYADSVSPINCLGVIGDRRTAAITAADGSMCWLCLPNYNGEAIFGSLLDAKQGGYWRISPNTPSFGRQYYLEESAVLITEWQVNGGSLRVSDFMASPANSRTPSSENARTVVRQVQVFSKPLDCVMELMPGNDFHLLEPSDGPEVEGPTFVYRFGEHTVRLWPSTQLTVGTSANKSNASFERRLHPGEDLWFVLELGGAERVWDEHRVQAAKQETLRYWQGWRKRLTFSAPRRRRVFHAAKLVHLLSFAPTGSLVAAPTTSLPERIGGTSNYDYRYAWLRDASLSLASLSLLGDLESSAHYMDWLVTLNSTIDAPLQPLYQIDGDPRVPQSPKEGVFGYRGSQPVLVGNHAYQQYQPDSYGYFAECALIYLQNGGLWKDAYWQLVRRLANFIADNWQRPSHGIWELSKRRHYVSSKVMAWVSLQRSIKIVEKLGLDFDTEYWQDQMERIHAEVMQRGWSEQQQSFVEYYGGEQLDASSLLMSVLDFLPPDHPRVVSMLEAIEEQLSINGLVYRFDPQRTLGPEQPPMGEFEGAFLPVTFMMATAQAKAGHTAKAEKILKAVECVSGETGLIAEEMDSRNREFLGNTPLIFSLVEYIRAVTELDKAKPLSKLAIMAGMAKQQLQSRTGW